MNNVFHSDEIAQRVPQRLARGAAVSVAGVYNAAAVDVLF